MYTRVDFLTPDRDDAYERMIEFAALMDTAENRGWVRRYQIQIQGRVWAAHNDTAKAVDEIHRTFGRTDTEWDATPDPSAPAKVRKLTAFRLVKPGSPGRTLRGSIGNVDHRGMLRAWFFDPDAMEQRPLVTVEVDGNRIGETRADVLRVDLLDGGIGDGEHGIEFALPPLLLDGGTHEIAIKAGLAHASALPESLTLRVQVPKYFSVPAPWRKVSVPDRCATAETLHAFFTLRTRIIAGGDATAIDDLRKLWDEQPDLVFYDAGLREAAVLGGSIFKSFRERISARLATWSRDRLCHLGADCCKNSRKPWGAAETLNRCPQPIRRFTSKAFTKDYARVAGIPVAKSLLVSQDIEEIRSFKFPDRFALKPDVGSKKCTFIYYDGTNLLNRMPVSMDEILTSVEQYSLESKGSAFIVEELIDSTRDGDQFPVKPLEYCLYVFGGRARIVLVMDRNVFGAFMPEHFHQGHFAPNWVPAPHRLRKRAEYLSDFQRPENLDAMIGIANRIGRDCGAYVRVDMYDTREGIRLGEVTTFSEGGRFYSEVGDLIISQIWEAFPDREVGMGPGS